MFPVYFARERTQFLMDHLKDLILSRVCASAIEDFSA